MSSASAWFPDIESANPGSHRKERNCLEIKDAVTPYDPKSHGREQASQKLRNEDVTQLSLQLTASYCQ
jgi:hypothetical protein